MKKTLIALAAVAAMNVQAAEKDNYVSVGMGTLSAETGVDLDSYGFVWNQIEEGKNLGFGMGAIFATNDYSTWGTKFEEVVWDITFNLPYRFDAVPQLVVYPMIGAAFYSVEASGMVEGSDSDIGLSYGVGAQMRIPSTNVFLDVNFKQADVANISADNVYFGIGYKF